jgi:8-oxo-dGTP diphosphatase / 2-hydroxy-dATP diphosphatase
VKKSKVKIVQTLCIVYKYPEMLLGMKKRGFGMGKWNSFGGKVKTGEKIEDAAKRELKEEIGIDAVEMQKVGIIDFDFENSNESPEVHFFWVKKWIGRPSESEEMRPTWFNVTDIPLDKMWPDDKYWIPLFLDDKKFRGKFAFDSEGRIVSHTLKVKDAI